MTLKEELYQSTECTLADNIDKAWSIYIDEGNDQADRHIAQEFLIYAFNIRELSDLNAQLIALMELRDRYKAVNPQFIPGLSPKHLNLEPTEMTLLKTANYGSIDSPKGQELFNNNELLDVVPKERKADDKYYTPYLNSTRRARYRVHLYNGLFYQQNKLFDTHHYSSHDKDHFAAFTINTNGELSVFNHNAPEEHLVHSSMNSGRPLFAAGELCIRQGRLIKITTYSGHYAPSLFNVYRTLEYFADKQVDLCDTVVCALQQPAPCVSRNWRTKHYSGYNESSDFFEFKATDLIKPIKTLLNQSLRTIAADIASYRRQVFTNGAYMLKDLFFRTNLTTERRQISQRVADLANELSESPENEATLQQRLVEKLVELQLENIELSVRYGKNSTNGRLHSKLDALIRSIRSIEEPQELEFSRREAMIRTF